MSVLLSFSNVILSQENPFVPKDFKVPTQLDTEHIRIRTLTVNDVVKDYDAVMSSISHLQGVFGPNSTWPTKELTFEQDLIDLGWHQKEFQIGSSFTYTVVRLDESEVIGCIYIFPTAKGDYNASITMWVRSSVLDEGLDDILFKTVKKWVKDEWPMKKVAYPGRDVSWLELKAIK
jgi:hypothetical protein